MIERDLGDGTAEVFLLQEKYSISELVVLKSISNYPRVIDDRLSFGIWIMRGRIYMGLVQLHIAKMVSNIGGIK